MFFCFTGKFRDLLPVFSMTYISASCFSYCGKNGDNWISGKKEDHSPLPDHKISDFSPDFPVHFRSYASAQVRFSCFSSSCIIFFHSITLNMPGQEPGTGFFRAEFCRGSVFRISRLREVCALYRIFTLGNSHLQKTTAKLRFFTVVFFRNKCSIFTGQSNRCVLYSFYEIEQMFLLIFHRLTESGESGC